MHSGYGSNKIQFTVSSIFQLHNYHVNPCILVPKTFGTTEVTDLAT